MGATVATDGALWVTTTRGLVRRAKGRDRVMGKDEGELFAGPNGSVWVSGDGRVTQYHSHGTRTALDFPGRTDGECLLAAGSDGSVWVSAPHDREELEGCDSLFWLVRWDGRRWMPGELKGARSTDLVAVVVSDDGAVWTGSYSGGALGRYHDGRWATLGVERLWSLTAVPGGRVCGLERDDPDNSWSARAIVCYNRRGEVARFDVSGMGVWGFSVAPDGAIWVKGDPLARLDDTLPMT